MLYGYHLLRADTPVGWPCVGLRFKDGTDTTPLLDKLLSAADESNGAFAVSVFLTTMFVQLTPDSASYTHATMPERWHFNATDRIAPIYVVPHLGWALTDHVSRFNLPCSILIGLCSTNTKSYIKGTTNQKAITATVRRTDSLGSRKLI